MRGGPNIISPYCHVWNFWGTVDCIAENDGWRSRIHVHFRDKHYKVHIDVQYQHYKEHIDV